MTQTLLEAALDYAHDGWEVFPLNADKTPQTTNGFKDASSDPDLVERWWSNSPNALIGCRIPPEAVAFDIDPRHGGDDVWAALLDLHGQLPTTRCHFSGRNDGGFHVWFKRPPGLLTMSKLTEWAKERGLGHAIEGTSKWTSGIDLLHHNSRYTILPPSPHPDTGEPYHFANSGAIAEAPAWLVDLLVADDIPAAPPKSSTYEGDSVADWFSETANWRRILEPKGWEVAKGDGDSDGSRWRHPNATAPHSATISNGCLFVYSPNTPFPETVDGAPRGQTRFRAFAKLYYNDDLKAAARAAGELPGAPSLPERDLSAFIKANTPAEPSPDDPWPAPAPLERVGRPRLFPVHVFPDWISDRVESVAESVSTPIDLPAVLALGALSTACLGKLEVELKPDYVEETNLYIAVALPPSTGKSPVFKRMMAPIYAAEIELRRDAEVEVVRATARRDALDKQRRNAENKGDVEAAVSLAMQVHTATQEIPLVPQLISDDATPEAFAELLASNGGRMAIMSTEGGPFELMAGRYSEGNKSRLEVYLGAWSGDAVRVNRIRRDEPIIIPKALATLTLTVQPVVLEGLAEDMRGKGLTARIMYSMPSPHRRVIDTQGEPGHVRSAYEANLAHLIARMRSFANPGRAALSPSASRMWIDYAQALSDRTHTDLAGVAEWIGKMTASVGRVAALLHVAHGGEPTGEISADIMAYALEVGDYWLDHALTVHSLWDADGAARRAGVILDAIADSGELEFTPRRIMFANRRAFPTRESFDVAVRLLVDAGWVRLASGKHGAHGSSKDAPTYLAHPISVDEAATTRAFDSGEPVGTYSETAIHDVVAASPPVDNPEKGGVVAVVDVVLKACGEASSSSSGGMDVGADTAPPPQRTQRPQRQPAPVDPEGLI